MGQLGGQRQQLHDAIDRRQEAHESLTISSRIIRQMHRRATWMRCCSHDHLDARRLADRVHRHQVYSEGGSAVNARHFAVISAADSLATIVSFTPRPSLAPHGPPGRSGPQVANQSAAHCSGHIPPPPPPPPTTATPVTGAATTCWHTASHAAGYDGPGIFIILIVGAPVVGCLVSLPVARGAVLRLLGGFTYPRGDPHPAAHATDAQADLTSSKDAPRAVPRIFPSSRGFALVALVPCCSCTACPSEGSRSSRTPHPRTFAWQCRRGAGRRGGEEDDEEERSELMTEQHARSSRPPNLPPPPPESSVSCSPMASQSRRRDLESRRAHMLVRGTHGGTGL